MNEFLDSLSLPSNIVKDTKDKLESESVTFEQLMTVITDEDLEEIGVAQQVRLAINKGIQKHREKEVLGGNSSISSLFLQNFLLDNTTIG